MRELGIGVVGYGFIGKVHTWAHTALPFFYDPAPARTRLVGVCTATPETGRKAVEQAGFDYATTDSARIQMWRRTLALQASQGVDGGDGCIEVARRRRSSIQRRPEAGRILGARSRFSRIGVRKSVGSLISDFSGESAEVPAAQAPVAR